MFKPKKVDKENLEEVEEELKDALVEEVEEEIKDALEEKEELIKQQEIKEEVEKEETSPKLTIKEVVDMIEGHILRANQLLQLLK